MLVRLVVTAGYHLGKVFEFTEHRTFLAGRAVEAHLRFPDDDPFISRLHFLIEVNPPEVRLVDLGSTNGTSVNGKPVTDCRLRDGDSIEAGDTRICVFIPDQSHPGRAAKNHSPVATLMSPPLRQNVSPQPNADPFGQSSFDAATADSEVGSSADGSASRIVGGYVVERELGRGTFGIVYLVSKGDQKYALKQLHDQNSTNARLARRFIREVRILQQLQHRSLVRFVEAGQDGAIVFLVTEYLDGENLEQLVCRLGPLKVRSAVRIIRHALSGLAHAHGLGFVHRDIKPANIIVNSKQVKLADFGLAASYQSTVMSGCTLAGESGGSIGYMPPEQLIEFHDAKPTNDIYSIGATLYRLLTGYLPYDLPDTFSRCVRQILQGNPVPVENRSRKLPSELCAVVNRCLARQPTDRWRNAKELYEALQPFTQKHPQTPRPAVGGESKLPLRESRRARLRPTAGLVTSSLKEDETEHIAWRIPAAAIRGAGRVSSAVANYTAKVSTIGDEDYVVGQGDQLVFFSGTGDVRVRHECSSRIVGSCGVLSDQRAVVHCEDGMLACVSARMGIEWQTYVSEPLGWATPVVDGSDQVWICLSAGGLQRISAEGQSPRRAFYRCMVRLDSTALVEGPLMYVGGEDGRIHAVRLDEQWGKNLWNNGDSVGRCGWFINGSIQKRLPEEIIAKSGDGYLQGFSLNGQQRWRWKIPGTALADPVIDGNGRIYQAYSENGKTGGGLVCFDPDGNAERWSLRFEEGIESTPVLSSNGCIYVAGLSGQIQAIDLQGRTRWTTGTGAAIRSRLAFSNDEKLLFAVGDTNDVIAVCID